MRTLADVSLRKGSDRQRLRGVLLIRSPSSVRFEALSPFGPPLMVVTVHEGQVTAYDALKNEARVGPADSETISKVLGLPLKPTTSSRCWPGVSRRRATSGAPKSWSRTPPDRH